MKHRLAIFAATIILLGNAITTSQATTATETGKCLNGASWSLTAKRDGNYVITSMIVKGLANKSRWNVNYAMIPINQVKNVAATANNQGVLTLKNIANSPQTLTTYIIIDSWAPIAIMTCAAGVTI